MEFGGSLGSVKKLTARLCSIVTHNRETRELDEGLLPEDGSETSCVAAEPEGNDE